MTLCKCGHDSDLHTLDALFIVDGPEGSDCDRLKWRFKCAGPPTGANVYAMLFCPCNNFALTEEKKV